MESLEQGRTSNSHLDPAKRSDRAEGRKSKRRRVGGALSSKLFITAIAIALVGILLWSLLGTKSAVSPTEAVATVTRGDLEITVLEGGNLKALESLELKSEVETRDGAKILSIVEEGYEVTPEDVEEKKILIKLDPTEIKERIEAHDIEFENAQTELTDTDESRAIQTVESQNEINVARQAARFALLDLEKYLGEAISREVLALRELPATEDALIEYEEKFRERLMATLEEQKGADSEDVVRRSEYVRINFGKYLEGELLGDGEAQQELRKLEDEWLVAQSEYAVEKEAVLGSERLADKEFITKATLDKQKVALKKAEVKELSTGTQFELYRRYEFPKKAEELLTKYADSLHLLDIEKKEALAKLSQAEAKFRSAEQMAKMAQKKRDELQQQFDSCTILATKPGLVVYGASERNNYYGGREETIEEGASVRYKQTIITIPDMRRMGVNVSIQESQVKKIEAGQKVRIVAEAEPDKTLTGEVKKVALLPDSNRWYDNPNQKVYPTEIHIDGTHDWLKPGMSAKIEIVVDELRDVVLAPLQSVMVDSGDTIVYAKRGGQAERTVIEPGGFNDEFIEIKSGLEEGEEVFLSKPVSAEGEAVSEPEPED